MKNQIWIETPPERVAREADHVHVIPEGGRIADHVVNDGPFCSCIPKRYPGLVAPSGKVLLWGLGDARWREVSIQIHNP